MVESSFPQNIVFMGERYATPSMDELTEWVYDSMCETPDGRTVEPDHPESWLSLLNLI